MAKKAETDLAEAATSAAAGNARAVADGLVWDNEIEVPKCYNSQNRHHRKPTSHADSNPEGRWRTFTYEELVARDKTSLDVSWLKDKSLTDLESFPEPDELAEEIIENLEAGLKSFREVLAGLEKSS